MESFLGSMIEMIVWRNIPELKKRLRSARQSIERGGVMHLLLYSLTDGQGQRLFMERNH